MPNTLAHFALNAAATRSVIGYADVKWVLLGAVIPDIPFIIKRAVVFLAPTIDVLDLRLLAIVQASLLFSLMLAFAFSLIAQRAGRVFSILGLGVFAHLLLDACQTKWGNGPSFFAPIDWSHTNFDLFWPEQAPSYVLTALGVLFLVYACRQPIASQADDLVLNLRRLAGVVVLLGIYVILPFAFMGAVEESGAGRVKLIRSETRTDMTIEIDRARFRQAGEETMIELFSGHFITLAISDVTLAKRGKISVKGTFVAHDVLRADEFHVNHARFRELASVAGLGAAGLYWMVILICYARRQADVR